MNIACLVLVDLGALFVVCVVFLLLFAASLVLLLPSQVYYFQVFFLQKIRHKLPASSTSDTSFRSSPDSAHAPPEGNPCLYMHLHTSRKVLDHASTRRTPLLVYTHPRQVSMPHQQWLVSSLRITDVSVVDSFLVPNPAQLTVDLLEFSLLSSTHLHCVQFSHKEDCWDKP